MLVISMAYLMRIELDFLMVVSEAQGARCDSALREHARERGHPCGRAPSDRGRGSDHGQSGRVQRGRGIQRRRVVGQQMLEPGSSSPQSWPHRRRCKEH